MTFIPFKGKIITFWSDLQSSYWFWPSVMASAALVLASLTTWLDTRSGTELIEKLPFILDIKPDGARAVLSTVAGSMITVAGVTFSITIASVSFASGQFGPRILTNFMRDRGNQLTLGTFIATFVYGLVVLLAVRTPEAAEGAGFVPHVSLGVALVLAGVSIGVLIFFIHHVPESIHISNVIAEIGLELGDKVDTLFPERIGEGARQDATQDEEDFLDALVGHAKAVESPWVGYLQSVDDDALMAIAKEHDMVLRLTYRPGDFVHKGNALLYAYPPDKATDEVCDTLHRVFTWGRKRTPLQDLIFMVDELVEIAARALSPGVNDPFTAISCLDWLGSLLGRLSRRTFPEKMRRDKEDTIRVVAEPLGFGIFADHVFRAASPVRRGRPQRSPVHLQDFGRGGRTRPRTRRSATACRRTPIRS